MKERKRILVVDDEPEIRALIELVLEQAGFQVLLAKNGLEGLQRVFDAAPDLILLDIQIPEIDGHTVCARVREMSPALPIIMLTVFNDQPNKIQALREGADDYIVKPFEREELIERIHAVMRRSAPRSILALKNYDDGHLKIEFSALKLFLNAHAVELSTTEWRLLTALYQNRGSVVSDRVLLAQVWGAGYEEAFGLLRVTMSNLRRKLREDAYQPRWIHTQRGVGYYFQAER